MATTGKTSRRQSSKQRWVADKGLWFLGAVAAFVVALGALMLFTASREAEARPVERFMHVHGLAAPAWAPGELYVSTHQGLIHVDAEGNWRYVSRVNHDFMGFQAHPSEEGVLYSSGHPAPGSNLRNPVGFMVSRDSGATWQSIALEGQVDFHTVAVQRANGDAIYGWSGGLYRSLDGGRNWEALPAEALAQAGGALSLAVHPEDQDTVLAGTQAGLLRSSDGGRSWERLFSEAPVTAVAYGTERAERIVAYGAQAEAGLLLSDDDGASWTRLDFALEDDAIGYIALHPEEQDSMYLGSYSESLYVTTNRGATWQQLADGGVPQQP